MLAGSKDMDERFPNLKQCYDLRKKSTGNQKESERASDLEEEEEIMSRLQSNISE